MSLAGKKSFNLFIVFIVILLYTETVTSKINYNEIRHDAEPYRDQAEEARTIREILTMINDLAIDKPILNFQQATEHLLHFGALLRIQILDIFGPLVYDHYDDYSNQQMAALYRVYQETLEKKYNIFNIVPSVLRNPDIKPTNLCRHIQKYVHTCLRESSMSCMTISKHDEPQMHSLVSPVVKITKRIYKRFYIKEKFSDGFSLPAVLNHLKTGTLRLTVGLMSGLVHNIQYDSFDDEVRTAERNLVFILTSEMFGSDAHKVLIKKDRLSHIHTVNDLFKEMFRLQSTARITEEMNKNIAILLEHMVDEIQGISQNIVLLSTVYGHNTIDMKYLLDLILPQDVVDEDITDAKNYLLEKINDYDIVAKYLHVERYQQSSPDQLLLEILGQIGDIDFAVDIVTALHVHARFWRQSHMINNLNELLGLFDAYKNLVNVPQYSSLMSLMDKIRNTLWDSKNVTVKILCNNPRVCLRLGLKTVSESEFIDAKMKNDIDELFYHLHESKVIHNVDECNLLMNSAEKSNEPQTAENPIGITGEDINDFTNHEELVPAEVYNVKAAGVKSEETLMPITNAEETRKVVLTTEGNVASPTTTEILTELLAVNTEDTTSKMSTLTMQDATETMEQQTTDSIDGGLTTTPVTIKKPVSPNANNESMTETQGTKDQATEKLKTTADTTVERTSVKLTLQETTSTKQNSDSLTEQSTTGEEMTTTTTTSGESTTEFMIADKTMIISKNVLTTTVIPTSGENPITITTVPEATTTSSSSLTSENITSIGEDCSGETCTSDDCSGEGCRPHTSPLVIINSADCSGGTNCNITGRTDCNEDGSCPSTSNTDQCDGSDCKTNTTQQNYQHDCSGDNCSPTVGVSQNTEVCEGDGCSRPSSKWDILSTRPTFAKSIISDCVDDDCSEVSKSNESACNDDDCVDSDESQPMSAMQETDPTFPRSTPPDRTRDKLGGDDSLNKLPSSRPTRRVPTKFHLKSTSHNLPPWLQLPRKKILGHFLPWRPLSQHPFQAHNFNEKESGHQLIGVGTKNRTKAKTYLNINTNINFIGLRRNVDGNGDATTSEPQILETVNPPNSSEQRVVTEVSNGLGWGKRDQKPQHESDVNLELEVPSEKRPDISRSREVSPMRMKRGVHQTKESDGNIERMRKSRSIVKAPQRASRRYLR